MQTGRPRTDLGSIAALTWLSFAVMVTIAFGPLLGLRGWAWLGLHHVLCVVGCTHELRRARERRAQQALDTVRRIQAGRDAV